ncbi:NADH-quinone oxidoreductase subunit NuoK [Buchnera aphidicola (Ceratoglyphina bambusae)]|uniref:NADH-quinone oxidoreductase subunit NuoK n=1 Tax=Buchnera aphidicola TaxID=9 RepID=UPI0031B81F41
MSILNCFIFCVIMFLLGVLIFILKKNLFFMLIGIEIMTNACLLLFVISSNFWNSSDGNVMYIFIITTSAAEVCVSLSFLFKFYKINNTLNIDSLSELKK